MADEFVFALSTFPDVDTARRIARELVALRLAACGNIVPQVHSIYSWKGKVESGDEALGIFKLSAKRYPDFQARLRALHPYDVPEIIAVKIDDGWPDYLRWLTESCASDALPSNEEDGGAD